MLLTGLEVYFVISVLGFLIFWKTLGIARKYDEEKYGSGSEGKSNA